MERWFGDQQASTATPAGFDSRALRHKGNEGVLLTGEFALTPSQLQRIKEMGGQADASATFASAEEREAFFSSTISALQNEARSAIRRMAQNPERHILGSLEHELATALGARGFIEVKTPMMIPVEALAKMGVDESHPLYKQVFMVDRKKCMRPMLAPNLYFLMRHLSRSVPAPLRLFEIGPCFRKESHGSNHLEEFTMLNLVEMEPQGDAMDSLKGHIAAVMDVVGLPYELVECTSEVYGATVDVEVDGVELASGAVGPIPMDAAHHIDVPWAGVGFGLERIELMRRKEKNVRKVGRSLIYLNGARIDI